jgi:adenine-specific DNA-methyltransferase
MQQRMSEFLEQTDARESPARRATRQGDQPTDERRLAQLAVGLGAAHFGGDLSREEEELLRSLHDLSLPGPAQLDRMRAAILLGEDPLGTALCALRPSRTRRAQGAFYTPPSIVSPMVDWVLRQSPDRLVDPGCGSGRFAASAVRRDSSLPVIAIDMDPIATLLTRATLNVLGAQSARVIQADYMTQTLGKIAGRTAFVGNPPYVRHHALTAAAK